MQLNFTHGNSLTNFGWILVNSKWSRILIKTYKKNYDAVLKTGDLIKFKKVEPGVIILK